MRYIAVLFFAVLLSSFVWYPRQDDLEKADFIPQIPIKITSLTPYDSTEMRIEYDDMMRIIKVKSLSYNRGQSIRESEERSVIYNDKSELYIRGESCIVDSLLKTSNYYLSTNYPLQHWAYRFRYRAVSQNTFAIRKNERDLSSTFLVNRQSGCILRIEEYRNFLTFFADFSYDSAGNLNKFISMYAGDIPEAVDLSYDNKHGIFSYVKTPQWFILKELFPLPIPAYSNNCISMMTDNAYNASIIASYEYNKDGFPSKIILSKPENSSDSVNNTSLKKNEYYIIEYKLLNAVVTKSQEKK